ncbi:OmpA family protein [Pseudomonas chlororaphis]|nr:OmpA family protein [Pseudomonas chlororaphis]
MSWNAAHPMPEVPPAAAKTRRRRLAWWLIGVTATIISVCGLWWWNQVAVEIAHAQMPRGDTVHLDSLSLFDVGSSELKPSSSKVLVNALVNIKAQPGWLIVIVGHTDTTGDAQQNLQLSYARASAVRDWMQRMGDIPDSCFSVQGMAGRQPIASNETATGRVANRRVDIQLVPQAGVCG